MRSYLLLVVLITLIGLTACVQETDSNVEVHVIGDAKVDKEAPILEVFNARFGEDGYILEDEPMFTINDIKIYEWSNHKIILDNIYFDTEKSPSWLGGSVILGTDSQDKFMVFVDGELIYEGYYEQSLLSSFMPFGPIMSDEADGISIDFRKADGNEVDLRGDIRIYECLKSAGVLLDAN